MTNKLTRIGSMIILAFIGLGLAGCIITTSINIGHHQRFDKTTDVTDAYLEQGYTTSLGKRK